MISVVCKEFREGVDYKDVQRAMNSWMTSISRNTTRMSEDEEYRLEIAKDIS
jgi:hypothetical protein